MRGKGINKNWYTIFLEKTEPIIDNGRILAANHLTVWLTEIDLRNYELFYTWKKAEVLECKKAAKGFLPDYVRYPIMVYYEIKSKLKKADIAYQKQTELTYAFTNGGLYVYEDGELSQNVGSYSKVTCFYGDEKNYYLGINNDDLYLHL